MKTTLEHPRKLAARGLVVPDSMGDLHLMGVTVHYGSCGKEVEEGEEVEEGKEVEEVEGEEGEEVDRMGGRVEVKEVKEVKEVEAKGGRFPPLRRS